MEDAALCARLPAVGWGRLGTKLGIVQEAKCRRVTVGVSWTM